MPALVRSHLFNVFFFAWTVVITLVALPALPFLSAAQTRGVARVWERVTLAALRLLIGIDHEVRGRQHLPAPDAPTLIASKHQSAWETLAFHLMVPNIAIGLKHELTRIPVLGWYLTRAGGIRIDRGDAARALRSLVKGAKAAVADGLSVLIFPEGTRQAPGAPPDYKHGVAALYSTLQVPVVPVALNSGLFWGRRSIMKRPGRIVVEFLEPIPPGLDRQTFMALLESRIEAATARLLAEGRAGQPGAIPL